MRQYPIHKGERGQLILTFLLYFEILGAPADHYMLIANVILRILALKLYHYI